MNRIIKRFLSTSRQYPAHPLVGVSCIIFKEPDYKKVVLIERGKPPKLGEWSFPGGLVNAGETIEEAVNDILDFYFGDPERMNEKARRKAEVRARIESYREQS